MVLFVHIGDISTHFPMGYKQHMSLSHGFCKTLTSTYYYHEMLLFKINYYFEKQHFMIAKIHMI